MRSRRITITVYEGVSDHEAISEVARVISKGRISKDGECYCYATLNRQSKLVIGAELTRAGGDTFKVYREGDA